MAVGQAHRVSVISRAQARAGGMTDDHIEARVRSGRWQRIFRGVYATFSGPLPRSGYLRAVVLWAGRGAMLSHETAAELCGLIDGESAAVHVTIPGHRRLRRLPGVVVHHSARAGDATQPNRDPPRTTVEETVVDLAQRSTDLDQALGWLARACGRRLTTPHRIADALSRRRKVRWRVEMAEALGDVADGCHSVLELRFLRAVERGHRLPTGDRQVSRRRLGGRWYDDVHYPGFRTRVELDGRVAHPDQARWRDMRRDNAATAGGDVVLRYGWTDVADRPCGVAAQLADVLRQRGWTGRPARCGSRCALPRQAGVTRQSHTSDTRSGVPNRSVAVRSTAS